jgi:hypothetical protein
MTSHQLNYSRYLLRQIKNLHIEMQAMSVLLDSPRHSASQSSIQDSWRSSVQQMKDDPVFCSAVEANRAPYFSRLERALQDELLFEGLQRLSSRVDPGNLGE